MVFDIKKLFSYSALGALSSLVGFLSIPYLTRVLSAEEFGIIGLFSTVLYFLVPTLSFSSESLVGIKKVELSDRDYQVFVNQYITLIILIFLSVTILSILLYITYSDLALIIGAILIVSITRALSRVNNIELVQDGKSIIFGFMSLSNAILLFILTVLSISFFNMDWQGRVLAFVIVECIILFARVLCCFNSFRNFKFSIDIKKQLEIGKFGFPLMLLLVASWLLNESDRLIVLNYLDLASVGIYSAAYTIGLAINVFNNAMTNTIVPTVYNTMNTKTGRAKLVKLNIIYSSLIVLTSITFCIIFSIYGGLILGPEYSPGVSVTCIVIIASGFNGLYRIVCLPLDFLKKTKLKAINFWFAAVINVIVSIYLIDYFGINAPAIGTLFSFVVLYATTFLFYCKHTKHLSD